MVSVISKDLGTAGFPLAALSTQKQGAQEAVIPPADPKRRVLDLFAMETVVDDLGV